MDKRIVPDTIIIVLGAFPLLYFLITMYPRLRPDRGAGRQDRLINCGDAVRGQSIAAVFRKA